MMIQLGLFHKGKAWHIGMSNLKETQHSRSKLQIDTESDYHTCAPGYNSTSE